MKNISLLQAFRDRRTTNGHFDTRPVSLEHQHLIIEAASRAPSHFNSQPWRFVLVDDPDIRSRIAAIGGRTMQQLMDRGTFFQRYRKYFRFSAQEMDERRDGIFIDKLPGPLKPFIKQVMSDSVLKLMSSLGVSKILGEDNRKLIEGSPLLLAVMVDREEYRPGELSAFYCTLSAGMAIEHIWLLCEELGMGIQFISTPMEIPEAWAEVRDVLRVPDSLELLAVYRLGYRKPEAERPKIDWQSNQRKRISQLAFRNTCDVVEPDPPSNLL